MAPPPRRPPTGGGGFWGSGGRKGGGLPPSTGSKKRGLAAFIHTKIDPDHEGEGLGSALISSALDATRDRGLSVLPFCPFVRAFIERHPEYAELVPECNREEFGL